MSIGQRMFSLFGRNKEEQPLGPTPDRTVYAVGDIHGRIDLLELMLEKIEADRAGAPGDIVFLGDYIDRGPASAEVLQRLRTLSLSNANIVCLLGNHERMFLDFLADPERYGPRWLQNGGRETLESFSGSNWAPPAGASYELACRDRMVETAGVGLIQWIEKLPLKWRSGDLGCVHAATDPLAGWDDQSDATLLWGRPKPNMPARSDGMWIAHGHTVVEKVTIQNRRIATDTGAYMSGVLSAVRSSEGSVSVLSVRAPNPGQL